MSVNKVINGALSGFGFPIQPDTYKGAEKKYFTFNYADDRPAHFSDDEPQYTIAYMQIHFFMPLKENYLKIKNQIREALFKAGFTYPAVTISTENDIRHIVFECDIEEEREEI